MSRRSTIRLQLICASALFALWTVGCGGGAASTSANTPTGQISALTVTTPYNLPTGLVGQSYSVKLQASGGAPPYTWTIQSYGSIPGLALASDGTLSGTPAQQGEYYPTLSLADSKGSTLSVGFNLNIVGPLSFSTPTTLPAVNVALPVSESYIAVTGGLAPYSFSLASGSVPPPGLTLSSSGNLAMLQGTPTKPGTYTFTIQATDSFTPPSKISQAFTLDVLNNVVLTNQLLPGAVQNVPYAEYLVAAGGTPPYHFGVGQFSTFPPGLSLDSASGKVFGTPTVPQLYFLTVSITDSATPPAVITPAVSLNVEPPLSFQTSSFPDAARGIGYFGNVTVNGGRPPYSVQVANGALPVGLSGSLSYGTFNVTGVPNTDGLYQFTIQVSDSYETPNTAQKSFQVRISDPLTITGPSSAQILYNQSYTTTFPASGGYPPYTWSMSTVPPAGFTFDPTTGTLSGTASGGSFSTPTIQVKDSSTPPLTANLFGFALDIYSKLAIITSSLPDVTTSSNVLLEPAVTGGAPPYQWTVGPGSLPPGIALNTAWDKSTILSGSPTTAGSYTLTFNISDGNTGTLHQNASQQLTWIVKDPGQMTRNDTIAQATPVSNISFLASISPFSDPSSSGADVDIYAASAAPGSIVNVYVSPNDDFIQPPEPNSLQPVMEIVDATGARYQTCAWASPPPGTTYNLPCINGLPPDPPGGPYNVYIEQNYYTLQVPGSGTAPVTFYVRVSDARGDARPDFIYTFVISGVN